MHILQPFYTVHIFQMTNLQYELLRVMYDLPRNPCMTGRKSPFYYFETTFFSMERFREIMLDLWNVVLCPSSLMRKVPHQFPCPFPDTQNKDCAKDYNVIRWPATLKENSFESKALEGKTYFERAKFCLEIPTEWRMETGKDTFGQESVSTVINNRFWN